MEIIRDHNMVRGNNCMDEHKRIDVIHKVRIDVLFFYSTYGPSISVIGYWIWTIFLIGTECQRPIGSVSLR